MLNKFFSSIFFSGAGGCAAALGAGGGARRDAWPAGARGDGRGARPAAARVAGWASGARGRVAAGAGACVARLGLGVTAAYVAAESRLALALD